MLDSRAHQAKILAEHYNPRESLTMTKYARLIVATALLMAAAAAQAQIQADKVAAAVQSGPAKPPVIVADPAVRFGTLPNGLHYAILQNHIPAGAVSVRLALDVGSFEEAEDERGYAHFIEHMAFRSTRLAPNGVLDDRFAALGVAFGRDQNAFTQLTSTIYAIDLPASKPEGLKDVLDWLHSGAEDILFTPAAVDSERGVVLAEMQTRNGPVLTVQREINRFQGPGLRSADREPGGTEASIKAASPARLQAFYDRWYRPENATLVVVGDASPDSLQRLVEQSFSQWKGRGPIVPRPQPPARLPDRGLEAFSLSNGGMPAALNACRLAPKTPAASPMDRIRQDALARLWSSILDARLMHMTAATGSPMLGAMTIVNHDAPDSRGACLIVLPTAGKWQEALEVAQGELRRFVKDGPTETEVSQGIERVKAPLRGAVVQQSSRVSADLATAIASASLDKHVYQTPSDALETLDYALGKVDAAAVKAAFTYDWSGLGPLLAIVGPDAPPKEALLAAWQKNDGSAPLAAYADRATARWTYDFGRPGKVALRQAFANPDFVRIRFRNGVLLNFRHSALEAGDAEIRIRFGLGASGMAPEERGPAFIGTGLFPAGGLGKLDFEQIGAIFSNTSWRFTLSAPSSAFMLSSDTLTDQVGDELKLLAAYMTDPGFRPTIDEKLPTAIDFAYRYIRTDAQTVAMDAIEQSLFPGQGSLPEREKMDAWHARDFERLLKPALTKSPIEVTIVGDMTEKEAVADVAASFGALPSRKPPAEQPTYPFRRFPESLPPPIAATHQGPASKAAALLMWPLYVASPERRKEEYALTLVAAIFQARLIQQVRVKMGKVYSPGVVTSMPDFADQGFLAVGMEAAPGDLPSLIVAARAIATELAT
ncbi:MAG: hypothetical protein JWO25_683, partial [Alphaproteobacteria bacterium]|nr:hypothetical protein [Alphaproteobacteria bacterium]